MITDAQRLSRHIGEIVASCAPLGHVTISAQTHERRVVNPFVGLSTPGAGNHRPYLQVSQGPRASGPVVERVRLLLEQSLPYSTMPFGQFVTITRGVEPVWACMLHTFVLPRDGHMLDQCMFGWRW